MENSKRDTACGWAEERIDAYVDGDLAVDEAMRIEAHCGVCVACGEALGLARRVRQALRDMVRHECPDGLVDAVLARASHESSRSERPPGRVRAGGVYAWKWRVAAGLAAAAVLVIAGLVGLQPDRSPDEVTQDEIARAETQVKLTFAYLGQIGVRSMSSVREALIHEKLAPSMRGALTTIISPISEW